MTACSERLLALQAFADGELDALAVIELEAHLRACPACREELERIEAIRRKLRAGDLRPAAPAALRERVDELLAPATSPARAGNRARGLAWSALGGGAIGAIAASLALLLALPQLAEPGLPGELVASHIRSLQAAHLVDVATSDRHVVKPWFEGRIDFSPPVPDLARQGFPLVGGRLDVIDGESVAAIVYKRSLHRINLFVRPAPALSSPFATSMRHDSYSLARWRAGGLEFWAVSDIDAADLAAFRRAYTAAAKD